jgi:hypothetical protein
MVESGTMPGYMAHYGWTNDIADILISRWEFYADSIKLCEGYGIMNSYYYYNTTTHNKAPILHAASGYHDGTDRSIQLNATPPELAFQVPLPGCQWDGSPGLPICAIRGQRLRLRVYIEERSKLVESSQLVPIPGSGLPDLSSNYFDRAPAPWDNKRIIVNGTIRSDRTEPIYVLGNPYIYAKLHVLHLDDESRTAIAAKPIELHFHRQINQILEFDTTNFIIGTMIAELLEIRGFFDAILVRFLSRARKFQNKYFDTLPPPSSNSRITPREWVSSITFIVNAYDRAIQLNPTQLRTLANNTKQRRDILDAIYYFVFGEPYEHEPAGSLFLSRTHKAQLNFTIDYLPSDPAIQNNSLYLYLLGIAWNILDIKNGQMRARFQD